MGAEIMRDIAEAERDAERMRDLSARLVLWAELVLTATAQRARLHRCKRRRK